MAYGRYSLLGLSLFLLIHTRPSLAESYILALTAQVSTFSQSTSTTTWYSDMEKRIKAALKRFRDALRGGVISRTTCGNGVLDKGEECEDGNRRSNDGCSNRCTLECGVEGECWPRCGDRIITRGESCDQGPSNSDTTPDACRENCRRPSCGDGVVDAGEPCDEGRENSLSQNACRPGCHLPSCGDGVVDRDYAEQCDGGTDCLSNCQLSPPPPCVCNEEGCRPNPDPWSDPHYGQCAGYSSPWTLTTGTAGLADIPNGLAVDSNGTIYLTFTKHNEPGAFGVGYPLNHDFILQKRDSCGNLIWERTVDIGYAEYSDHLDIDVCGNSYVTLLHSGIHVRKYTFRGDLTWENSTPGYGHHAAIAVDAARGVAYVVSTSAETVDGREVYHAWVRKYNAEDGSVLWTRSDPIQPGDGPGIAADVDNDGNLYTIFMEYPFLLKKLNPSGEIVWSIPLPGPLYQNLTAGTDGAVYVLRNGSSIYYDGPSGEILKYSTDDGSLLATHQISLVDAYGHSATGIAVDPEGNLYVTGVNVDNVATSVAEDYFWLLKLSAPFTSLWSDTMVMPFPALNLYPAWSAQVAVDPAGFVYVSAGVTTTGATNLDGKDVMLKKYTPSGTSAGSPQAVEP